MEILVLCHGKKLNNPTGCSCNTQLITIDNATFLDKNPKIKPHILQDIKKPFKSKKLYDIITTACCDEDVFYDKAKKSIVHQTFVNIKNALKLNGVFIIPRYYWFNKHILSEIKKYFTFIKKVKITNQELYIFKNYFL
jgi:hypothetical protein